MSEPAAGLRVALATFLEAMPGAAALLDGDLALLHANSAALALGDVLHCLTAQGLPPGRASGQSRSGSRLRQAIETVARSGEPVTRQAISLVVEREGEPRAVELLVSVSPVQGGTEGWLLVCLDDITEQQRREQELEASEARHRWLLEALDDAVLVYRLDAAGAPSRFVLANDVACARLAYDRDSLLGLSPAEVTAPDARAVAWPAALTQLRDDGRAVFETILQARDGRRLPVEITGHRAVLDGAEAHVIVARDLAERRRAAWLSERLRDAAAAMAACGRVADALPPLLAAALDVTATDAGGVYLVENGVAVLQHGTGLPAAFVEQVATMPLDHPAVRTVTAARRPQDLELAHGELSELFEAFGMERVLSAVMRADGEVIGFVNVAGLRPGETPPGAAAAFGALVEQAAAALRRIRAEELASLDRATLRAVFESIDDAIAVQAADGTFIGGNRAFARMVGLPQEDCRELLRHPEPAWPQPALLAAMSRHAGDGPLRTEEVILLPDGREATFDMVANPFHAATGERIGVVGVARDVSAMREARERLADALRWFEALAENVHQGLLFEDHRRVVRVANPALRHLFGLEDSVAAPGSDAARLSGTLAAQARHPEGFVKGIERCLAGLEPVLSEGLPMADGRFFQRDFIPVSHDGQRLGAFWIYRDRTRRRRSEEVQSARLRLSAMAPARTLEELLVATLDEAEALTQSTVGFFLFVDEDEQTWSRQACSTRTSSDSGRLPEAGRPLPLAAAGAWADCIREKRPVVHHDPSPARRGGEPPIRAELLCELVVPVIRQGRVRAVLGVGNGPRGYTESDVRAVGQLADLAWDIAAWKLADDAARAGDRLYRAVFEQCHATALLLDTETGEIVDANPAAADFYGYPLEQLRRMSMYDLSARDRRVVEQDVAALTAGPAREIQTVHRCADGTLKEIVAYPSPVEMHSRRLHYVVVTDQTSRLRAERALRAAMESTAQATGRDYLDGTVQAVAEALGCRTVMLVECQHESDELVATAAWCDGGLARGMRCRFAGSPCAEAARNGVYHVATGLAARYPASDLIHEAGYDSYYGVCLYDDEQRPMAMLTVLDDRPMPDIELAEPLMRILALRARSELLRMRAEVDRDRLAAAIEQARDAVLITGPDAVIQYANPACERATGYTIDQMLGRSAVELFPAHQNEAAAVAAAPGDPPVVRRTYTRRDGSEFVAETVVSPVADADGGILHYVAVSRDLSRELELEASLEQAQRMEAIGQLAGGVAHDLNNRLTPILGYAEMLELDTALTPSHRELAAEIRIAGGRARDLIAQLLAFARRQMLDVQPVDLCRALADLQPVLAEAAGEGVAVQLDLEPCPLWTLADAGQVRQALMSLVDNARWAMPDGGIVRITARSTEAKPGDRADLAPGAYISLAVADTGCGMDAETVRRAFEPFFSTRRPSGAGLGLATVHGIAKQHGGDVTIESSPGCGATVELLLPAAVQAPQEPRPMAKGAGESAGAVILLAEDHVAVRTMVSRLLRKEGYRVVAPASPTECLALAAEQDIDLVITDVVMPEMHGRELVDRLRALRPGLPVLFVSGYPRDVIAKMSELTEGAAFLQKPFEADDLVAAVAALLGA